MLETVIESIFLLSASETEQQGCPVPIIETTLPSIANYKDSPKFFHALHVYLSILSREAARRAISTIEKYHSISPIDTTRPEPKNISATLFKEAGRYTTPTGIAE